MLANSILAVAFLAVSAQAAAGSGPACLLAAMESSKNPSDWKSNCGQEKDTITGQMKQYCGADLDAAMTQYTAICKSVGADVSSSSSSSSSSASMSMTSSAAAPTGSGIGYGPGSGFGSGPNGSLQTFTLYDSACSCMKTTSMSSGASATGFVPYPTGGSAPYPAGNGTAGTGATGTGGYTAPTQPPTTVGSGSGSGSGSSSSPASTTGGATTNGAAAKQVSFVAAVLAAGAAAFLL